MNTMNSRVVSSVTALGLVVGPTVMKFAEGRTTAAGTNGDPTAQCVVNDGVKVSSRLGGGTPTSLAKGSEVEVLSQRSDSARISYVGRTGHARTGWIDAQDLGDCDVAPVPTPTPSPSPTTQPPPPGEGHGSLTAPNSGAFDGCDATGRGGDPQLNLLKNRTDEGTWAPVPFGWLAGLHWPQSIEWKAMDQWSTQDTAEVAQNGGRPVSIEGYLALARQEGAEACNCGLTTPRDEDFHIWLTAQAAQDRTGAIVVEMTGRVRDKHPGWTLTRVNKLVSGEKHVRVSGWTFLDPAHPDQVGKTRGTIWEIHPVMNVEVDEDGVWENLDSAAL
jgi:hypothetical protein